MAKNRLELRRMAEAAEKQKKPADKADGRKTKKRKATKRKTATRKTKERGVQRKRLVWCVFNGSMKEEGRFPYDQKAAAEEKLEQLRAKSKKLYFLQPVKEVIGETSAPVTEVPLAETDADTDVDVDADVDVDVDEEADEEAVADVIDDEDDVIEEEELADELEEEESDEDEEE